MAGLEDRAEGPRVTELQRCDRRADAFVFGLHMTRPSRVAGLELTTPVPVTRPFVGVPFAGAQHEDCGVVGQPDPTMLERPAVEQQRSPLAAE